MNQIPDDKIIRGILENRSKLIEDVYQDCFPMVERMVINSGGNSDLAKDVFQEGWITIYRKISAGELNLTCKFSTYLYAICKNIWFQERRKNITRKRIVPSEPEVVEEPEIQLEHDCKRIKELFYRHFSQLSKDCQKILILHINQLSIEEIQKIMNYQNSHYAMDRKYRCKKSLMLRILNDPNFKSVQNEYCEQIKSVL